MKAKRLASTVVTAIALAVPALVFAAPAHADPDTDFSNELHIYGIYGEKDYNAWIGKITCKRLYNGVDQDAYRSAKFILAQLPRTVQPSRRGSSWAPRCARTAPRNCRSSSKWRDSPRQWRRQHRQGRRSRRRIRNRKGRQ